MDKLKKKIEGKEAVVGVLGLGYVGLPLAVLFSDAGFPVLGFELDEEKKLELRAGRSYIRDIPSSRLKVSAGCIPERGRIAVADSMAQLGECDAIIICVPTPLAKTRDPDLSYIVSAAKLISEYLRSEQLIVLESTTYPGTTRELVLPMLVGARFGDGLLPTSGDRLPTGTFVVGNDFYLAFSPERVDPGNRSFNTKNTPKVIGGITKQCSEMAQCLYAKAVNQTVLVSSTDAAEMTKLLENTFRMINIGLVNEFAIMCNRLGVDVWEVIEAAATKPFGFMPFFPGPGLGGHCIPVDPHYLSWKLRLHDYRARFIELATEVNSSMPSVVVERVVEALNFSEKSVKGSNVLVLGVAYKKDIDDVRESPALDIISMLANKGARISYHDPFVPTVELHNGMHFKNVPFSPEILEQSDCVLVVTDHSQFDPQLILRHSPLVVDTRNFFFRHDAQIASSDREKVFRL